MTNIRPGDNWHSWIKREIADEEARLATEEQRLEGIRAGRQFKPRNISYGWTDRLAAQEAYVRTLRQWIARLRKPDMYLLRFLNRSDFGSYSWRRGFWFDRRGQFFRKHAGEPSWERARPRYARKRRQAAERRRSERERKTGHIDRRAIYERDGGICGICGKPIPADNFHLDHVDPTGPHGPENLRVAHPLCNVLRGWPGSGGYYPESLS